MKIERANVRRDCTVGLPPNVVEELGLVCGKNAVEFIMLESSDQEEQAAVLKTLSASAKNMVFMRGGK